MLACRRKKSGWISCPKPRTLGGGGVKNLKVHKLVEFGNRGNGLYVSDYASVNKANCNTGLNHTGSKAATLETDNSETKVQSRDYGKSATKRGRETAHLSLFLRL